jgi:hypothetical protein
MQSGEFGIAEGRFVRENVEEGLESLSAEPPPTKNMKKAKEADITLDSRLGMK